MRRKMWKIDSEIPRGTKNIIVNMILHENLLEILQTVSSNFASLITYKITNSVMNRYNANAKHKQNNF